MLAHEQLQIQQIEFNEVNGGSFRLFIGKEAGNTVSSETLHRLEQVRASEERLQLGADESYDSFRHAAVKVATDLRELLGDLKAVGQSVYIYGASTKGNTILQFCGIDKTLVPKAADRNPEKWGRKTLGTDISIISEEQARSEKPDYFLILPWHFFEVFVKREAAFLERGGKFILPLPQVRVVGIGDI